MAGRVGKTVKVTNEDIREMVSESVRRLVSESEGEGVVNTLTKMHKTLSEIMTGGFIPFASPNPSSTEREVATCIRSASDELLKAVRLCRKLGY